jgi:hypothetical protein
MWFPAGAKGLARGAMMPWLSGTSATSAKFSASVLPVTVGAYQSARPDSKDDDTCEHSTVQESGLKQVLHDWRQPSNGIEINNIVLIG